MKLRSFCFLLILFTGPVVAFAQCTPDPAQASKTLMKLDDLLTKANQTNTLESVAQYLDPEYIDIGVSGRIRNKAEFVAHRSTGSAKEHLKLFVSEKKLRVYGATATMTFLANVEGTDERGNPIKGDHAYVRVYSYKNGAWYVVSETSGPFYSHSEAPR